MTCTYCQRGIPLHNGIHCGEFFMERCTRELELVPKEHEPRVRETWYRPELRTDVPFVCGGER